MLDAECLHLVNTRKLYGGGGATQRMQSSQGTVEVQAAACRASSVQRPGIARGSHSSNQTCLVELKEAVGGRLAYLRRRKFLPAGIAPHRPAPPAGDGCHICCGLTLT